MIMCAPSLSSLSITGAASLLKACAGMSIMKPPRFSPPSTGTPSNGCEEEAPSIPAEYGFKRLSSGVRFFHIQSVFENRNTCSIALRNNASPTRHQQWCFSWSSFNYTYECSISSCSVRNHRLCKLLLICRQNTFNIEKRKEVFGQARRSFTRFLLSGRHACREDALGGATSRVYTSVFRHQLSL